MDPHAPSPVVDARPPEARSRVTRLAGLPVLLTLTLAGLVVPGPAAVGQGEALSPTIVLIVTDDQRFDSLWAMPNVRDDLVSHGVTFSNAFVVNSLCCPSRASILTGRYSHSTGVYTNGAPDGGFEAFQAHEPHTVATWLQAAGYRTGLFGKYLNGYGPAGQAGHVPPGWDRWAALAHNNGRYYDYDLNVDGTLVSHGAEPEDYSTDVAAGDAVDFIRETEEPLFLYFAPYAPHGPATPAPRHEGSFSDLEPWRPPSYDEADVSEKPAWVQALPRLTSTRSESIDDFRRRQYESLLAVDEAVDRIVEALEETGRLQTSLIVFTTDNGYIWGEHRFSGKEAPYDESIRVPLVVRYDPLITAARVDPHLVLNIDLAPTFADLAGTVASAADGASLRPLLELSLPSWRSDFLVEHLVGRSPIPTYCAVRSERYLYVEYETREEELYDLLQDPYQLDNHAREPHWGPTAAEMRKRLSDLCEPAPPGLGTGGFRQAGER
jgi:N-acetylglucosamine-6-sulfatase